MRGRDAASAISGGSIGAQFERGRPHHTAALSDCSLIETTDLPEGESSRASYLPQGLTSHRCPQCFRPRPSRSSKPSCDGDDDAWWWTSMEPLPEQPCSTQPQARPSEPPPGRTPASPTRWRKQLRKVLKGCASYSWISLISAALNGPRVSLLGYCYSRAMGLAARSPRNLW
jgi:hypothetical protein